MYTIAAASGCIYTRVYIEYAMSAASGSVGNVGNVGNVRAYLGFFPDVQDNRLEK